MGSKVSRCQTSVGKAETDLVVIVVVLSILVVIVVLVLIFAALIERFETPRELSREVEAVGAAGRTALEAAIRPAETGGRPFAIARLRSV